MSGGIYLRGMGLWELIIGTVGVIIVSGVAAAVYFLVKGASDKEN